MRKSFYLPLCALLGVLSFFTSCSKSATDTGLTLVPVKVYASQWAGGASMGWADTALTTGPAITTTWAAPGATEDILQNGLVLVYAKTTTENSEVLLPAAVLNSGDGGLDTYEATLADTAIIMVHSKKSEGIAVAPQTRSDVRFRYIVLQEKPDSNSRMETGTIGGSTFSAIKAMPYSQVLRIFNIAR